MKAKLFSRKDARCFFIVQHTANYLDMNRRDELREN